MQLKFTDGFEHLVEFLQETPTNLRTVSIIDCDLGVTTLKDITKAMLLQSFLDSLKLINIKVNVFKVSFIELCKHKNLKKLDLSHNKFQYSKDLIEVIKNTQSIQKILYRGNEISLVDIQKINEVIKNNHSTYKFEFDTDKLESKAIGNFNIDVEYLDDDGSYHNSS